jgi:3-methyladenine DNA glycosylase/8-oxoguanine DNA glycosylase
VHPNDRPTAIVPSLGEDVGVAEPDDSPATRSPTALSRVWRSDREINLRTQLGVFRRGSGDPTMRWGADHSVVRAAQTPDGVGTLHLVCRAAGAEVHAHAWGPGAGWLLDAVPALLGDDDDPSDFGPVHAPVADAWRRFSSWRVPRSGLLFDALAPAVIEQKVTGQEAFAGFRTLVHRFGERAPGAGAERGVWVQPSAETLRLVPSWEWLRMHIDPARSRTVVRACQVAAGLERTVDLPVDEVDRRLRSVPGIGVWTSAEVRFRAHGDADAVSFGDYHVAKNIGWALTGTQVDDDGLAELLEPYRPHRYRVQRLVELAGLRRPRHGPRLAPRRHLPA